MRKQSYKTCVEKLQNRFLLQDSSCPENALKGVAETEVLRNENALSTQSTPVQHVSREITGLNSPTPMDLASTADDDKILVQAGPVQPVARCLDAQQPSSTLRLDLTSAASASLMVPMVDKTPKINHCGKSCASPTSASSMTAAADAMRVKSVFTRKTQNSVKSGRVGKGKKASTRANRLAQETSAGAQEHSKEGRHHSQKARRFDLMRKCKHGKRSSDCAECGNSHCAECKKLGIKGRTKAIKWAKTCRDHHPEYFCQNGCLDSKGQKASIWNRKCCTCNKKMGPGRHAHRDTCVPQP